MFLIQFVHKKTEVHFIVNCMISDDKYKSKCNCYLKSNERIYFEFAYFPIVGPNAENYPTAHPSPSLIFSFLDLSLSMYLFIYHHAVSLAVLYLYLFASHSLTFSYIFLFLSLSLPNHFPFLPSQLLSLTHVTTCIGAHGTPFIRLLFSRIRIDWCKLKSNISENSPST